ncbi:hypothetical protein Dsin_012285 [Dipteronia sinensis]|uniref:Uncharacterized protein n=1 Tax=Dipteronia sinensis TaxID=43782 RepID=A0AAE0AIG4_9ROSI|nr:hypothetical protein Dsin_012285 [Dipteronia sinensis]
MSEPDHILLSTVVEDEDVVQEVAVDRVGLVDPEAEDERMEEVVDQTDQVVVAPVDGATTVAVDQAVLVGADGAK